MKKDLIHVVDEIMGGGKTSAFFNFMNTHPEKKYIFLTPALTEIPRVIEACPALNFKEPNPEKKNKTYPFKSLLEGRENIVTTHQLFFKQTEEIIEHLSGYVLAVDESPNSMVEDYDDKFHSDYKVLYNNYLKFDDNNRAYWIYEHKEGFEEEKYRGAFSELKTDCDQGYVRLVEVEKRKSLYKVFPAKILKAFDDVFIMTHLFRLQQSYVFLRTEGFSFDRYYVKEEQGKYTLTKDIQPQKHFDLLPYISFYQDKNKKGRTIGTRKGSLSKSWYLRNPKPDSVRNALRRFFDNTNSQAGDRLWTVFNTAADYVSGGRYDRSFIHCNAKATNDFSDRHYVAYLNNLYSRPVLSVYFKHHGVETCDNGFALTEMIQLIFRSAIRKKEKINLFIPSKRMYNLFVAWLDFLAGRTDRIAGINIDLFDWASAETGTEPQVLQSEIINADTGIPTDFNEFVASKPVIMPRKRSFEFERDIPNAEISGCFFPVIANKQRNVAYEALCAPLWEVEPEVDDETDMEGFLLGYDDVPEGIGYEPM